ncbi:hypothetical protein EAW55_14000 [Legionella jordanis]|uniref:Transmembrane protein n=2 Tax=Legionella jordanis TaxID=456 RepID=A0A0W0VG51_9GAMM|nr:hypothetical protein [Legionella jordanis]KTD19089.1 hypothetical protein Ljor_0055 [Legionella jordanis]RMW99313.1 hypothetical protein EAW55_14000 [Legionella jordanis]VEH12947.1 Uncharacterized conserved protein [Legionella jordanis]
MVSTRLNNEEGLKKIAEVNKALTAIGYVVLILALISAVMVVRSFLFAILVFSLFEPIITAKNKWFRSIRSYWIIAWHPLIGIFYVLWLCLLLGTLFTNPLVLDYLLASILLIIGFSRIYMSFRSKALVLVSAGVMSIVLAVFYLSNNDMLKMFVICLMVFDCIIGGAIYVMVGGSIRKKLKDTRVTTKLKQE